MLLRLLLCLIAFIVLLNTTTEVHLHKVDAKAPQGAANYIWVRAVLPTQMADILFKMFGFVSEVEGQSSSPLRPKFIWRKVQCGRSKE